MFDIFLLMCIADDVFTSYKVFANWAADTVSLSVLSSFTVLHFVWGGSFCSLFLSELKMKPLNYTLLRPKEKRINDFNWNLLIASPSVLIPIKSSVYLL